MLLTARTRTVLMVGGVLLVLWLVAWQQSGPREEGRDRSVRASVALADLPAEARETLVLIDRGGPFPFPRDGATFRNDEGLLPEHGAGYYMEYTVPTPGSDDRGARRLVVGGTR